MCSYWRYLLPPFQNIIAMIWFAPLTLYVKSLHWNWNKASILDYGHIYILVVLIVSYHHANLRFKFVLYLTHFANLVECIVSWSHLFWNIACFCLPLFEIGLKYIIIIPCLLVLVLTHQLLACIDFFHLSWALLCILYDTGCSVILLMSSKSGYQSRCWLLTFETLCRLYRGTCNQCEVP